METTTANGVWVDVVIPNPRPMHLNIGIKKAHEARRLRTKVNKDQLMQLLEAPPSDYDGSNQKLAEYMGMSERSVTRLLQLLAKDGILKIASVVNRKAGGGLFTQRFIQILKRDT